MYRRGLVRACALSGVALSALLAMPSARAENGDEEQGPLKICSGVYGDGFFNLPGTDTCLKIGGWVRAEAAWNAAANNTPFIVGGFPFVNGSANEPPGSWTVSAGVVGDVRFNAALPVRIFLAAHGTFNQFLGSTSNSADRTGVGTLRAERVMVQFAGLTFGRQQSYFDLQQSQSAAYWPIPLGDSYTGAIGTNLAAYTFRFGDGFTASISLEDSRLRRNAIWDAGTDALAIGFRPGPGTYGYQAQAQCVDVLGLTTSDSLCNNGDYAAHAVPDVVGSLRVDQAWGAAQIAGALHQVRAGYYGNNTAPVALGPGRFTGLNPADEFGYAAMAGVVINLPWDRDLSDRLFFQALYTNGALGYTGLGSYYGVNPLYRTNGSAVAAAWPLDAVFANVVGPVSAGVNPSGQQLTQAFAFGAAYQHHWQSNLSTTLFGNYTFVNFNAQATDMFCSSPLGPARTAAGATPNFATGAVIGCNPDFAFWQFGAHTDWYPVPGFRLGVQVLYTEIDIKHDPNTVRLNLAGTNLVPANQGITSVMFKAQRTWGEFDK